MLKLAPANTIHFAVGKTKLSPKKNISDELGGGLYPVKHRDAGILSHVR